jgi:hypothetical protein
MVILKKWEIDKARLILGDSQPAGEDSIRVGRSGKPSLIRECLIWTAHFEATTMVTSFTEERPCPFRVVMFYKWPVWPVYSALPANKLGRKHNSKV